MYILHIKIGFGIEMTTTQSPQKTLAWQIFWTLSASHQEGFFLDHWGGSDEVMFAFDPIDTRQGICRKGSKNFQEAWQEISSQIPQGDFKTVGGAFALVGYGCGLELDRVRGMDLSGAEMDFRLAHYQSVYVWSESLGLRLNGQQVEWPKLTEFLSWSVSPLQTRVESAEYEAWVQKTKDYILAGDLFQANLAHPIAFELQGCPFALYHEIRRYNPSPYAGFWFDKAQNRYLLSNSPELLFEINDHKIVTKPIAGTRKRGKTPEDDQRLKDELFQNEKEQAEHLMLVDLERNDLGRVSQIGTVIVEEFMGCEQYRNVTHIVSTVTGQKSPDKSTWDVLKALFPGGTITGAPKLRSMEIIHELEKYPRGLYTGSMGYFDGNGQSCFNILIRSMQLKGSSAQIHVGAGIVADSEPAQEYKETLNKAAAWKKVLYDRL